MPGAQRHEAGWELLPAQKYPGVHAEQAQPPPDDTYVPAAQLHGPAWAEPPAQLNPLAQAAQAQVAAELAVVSVDVVPAAQAQGAGSEPPPAQKNPGLHGPHPQPRGVGAPTAEA